MRDLFQRRGRSGTETGTLRLTLGAFGKHPGWDDHILGIGVETETLAQLKQILYVGGIGAQIDSGAWEKLDAEKRLPGFDHIFLCQRPGHVLLGELWSSTDGKGRAKYPMVLCIDGEGVSPGFMLKTLSGGLERLRSACRSTTSADQVARDCHSAQDQLRSMLGQDPSRLNDAGITSEARRRFLEHPRLGPDRLGFLRALHELKAAPAMAGNGRGPAANTVRSLRSSHLRLPLGADSAKEGILLWTNLLRCVLPEAVPLLLIARAQTDWLDILVNEPAPDDFFCLQAGPKALPLASEIPYQLAPDLKQRWQELETKFLGVEPSGAPVQGIQPPASPPPPRAPVPTPPVPPPSISTAVVSKSSTVVAGTEQRSSKLPLVAMIAVVVILAIAAIWFFTRGSHKPAAQSDKISELAQDSSSTKSSATNAALTEQRYQTALAAAHAAQDNKDYQAAIRQAELALKSKPGDPDASKLLEQSKQAAAVTLEEEQKYKTATNAAAQALLQLNYREASNQLALALASKPGDPVAVKMMNEAQQALTAGAQQQKYQAAIESAKTTFIAKDYQETANQAGIALSIKPGDAVATSLQTDARAAMQALAATAQQLQQYQSATNAAAAALSQSNYTMAIRQATMALAIRTNDTAALALKIQGENGVALASAKDSFARGDYIKAAEICQSHPNIDAFTSLATTVASEQKALTDANASFNNGDYASIERLKDQSYSTKTPFAKLISQATQERAVLTSLQSFRKTNGWQEVKMQLTNGDNASLCAKPPFAELLTWANTQAATPAISETSTSPAATSTASTNASDQTLRRLDTKLEVLLVQFEVLKPTARELKTDDARKSKPLPDGAIDTGYYLGQVDGIEAGLRQGSWLDQDNRKTYIEKLRKAINAR